MLNIFGYLVVVLTVSAFFTPLFLLQGFVLKKLWFWFLVSTFHVPELTMASSLGMIMAIRLVLVKINLEDFKNTELMGLKDSFFKLFLDIQFSLFVLAVGWLLHHFAP
jgi:hypothetical protein